MAECGQFIGAGTINYPCTLEQGHSGPHRAVELPRTVADRELWERDPQAWAEKQRKRERPKETPSEAERRHQASGLAEFQGRAQTTAERYTENPTSVPETRAEREERLQHEAREAGGIYIPADSTEVTHVDAIIHSGDPIEHGARVVGGYVFPTGSTITNTIPGTRSKAPFSVMKHSLTIAPGEQYIVDTNLGQVAVEVNEDGILVQVDPRGADPLYVPEPTKQRDGDQPLPEVSDRPYIQPLVIEDIQKRIILGIERYGTPLQPLNGRDTMRDAYEEALDLTVYLRSVIEERKLALGAIHVIEGFVRGGSIGVPREIMDAIDVIKQVLEP